MPLTRYDLREELQRHEIAPVYVLFGPETYLRDLAAKTITDRSFAEGDFRDMNENTFSLNDAQNLEAALGVARQLPMMASRRVVRINDVRISATGYRDTITENHEEALTAYFNDPSPSTTLIFVADELNGVRKMGKFLRGQHAVDFAALDDRELTDWARREFSAAGAEIDGLTLKLFMSRIGPDLRRMTNEIKKIATAGLPDTRITTQLVEDLIPVVREVNNYALSDAIVAGRKTEAVALLQRALDDGAEPLMLLGLLGSNYRRMLMAKDMMDRGADRREVGSVIRMPPQAQESFFAATRRVDAKKLQTAVKRLAATDLAIKSSVGGSGPSGARLQIEMLVCELALL